MIKSIVYNFESQKHKCHSHFEAKKHFHSHYQTESVSVDEYHETFNNSRVMIAGLNSLTNVP